MKTLLKIAIVLGITLAVMLLACLTARALSQPLQAAEKDDRPLASGYIPVPPPKQPQEARRAVSSSSGYVISLETGKAELVTVQTYQSGNRTITTGQIGMRHIHVDTSVKPTLEPKRD